MPGLRAHLPYPMSLGFVTCRHLPFHRSLVHLSGAACNQPPSVFPSPIVHKEEESISSTPRRTGVVQLGFCRLVVTAYTGRSILAITGCSNGIRCRFDLFSLRGPKYPIAGELHFMEWPDSEQMGNSGHGPNHHVVIATSNTPLFRSHHDVWILVGTSTPCSQCTQRRRVDILAA